MEVHGSPEAGAGSDGRQAYEASDEGAPRTSTAEVDKVRPATQHRDREL